MSVDWFALNICNQTGTGHIDVYKRDPCLFPPSAKSAKMLSCSGPNKLDLETLELIAHFITCQSVFFLSILLLFMYYCMFYFCIYVAMTPQHKHFFWPCKADPTNKDCQVEACSSFIL